MRKYLWLLAMIPLILYVDPYIAQVFAHTPHWIKPTARVVSKCINPLAWLMFSIGLVAILKAEWTKVLAMSMGAGIVIARLLKIIIGRSRPNHLVGHGISTLKPLDFSQTFDSFPSSHTLAIFIVATSLATYFPKYRYWIWGCAGIASLSRVILNRHFLSDVFSGAFLGIFITKKIGQVRLARLEH